MSYEVFGDGPEPYELPDGYWCDTTVQAVQESIRALCREPVYENRRKEDGISVRFLARLTDLQGEAGLMDLADPRYKEAVALLASEPLPSKPPTA